MDQPSRIGGYREKDLCGQVHAAVSPPGGERVLLETGSLQKGDTVMIIGQKAGMIKEELLELRVNGVERDRAAKGDQLTFPLSAKLSIGDKLYQIVKAVAGQDRSVPQ